MARKIIQNAVALIASVFIAIFLLAMIEWISAMLHPFPADFAGTSEEVMQHVANYPTWILASLGGLGWALTTVVATWLATRFSTQRHPAFGIGIGLLLLAAAIFNMSMLPYPTWFWILNFLLLPLGIFAGAKLGMRGSAQENALAQ